MFLPDALDYSSPLIRLLRRFTRSLTPSRIRRRRQARQHKEWLEERRAGQCERCGGYGLICLNGQQFLCWEHYCQEMQKHRSLEQSPRDNQG